MFAAASLERTDPEIWNSIGLGKSAAKHGDHSVRFSLQPEIA